MDNAAISLFKVTWADSRESETFFVGLCLNDVVAFLRKDRRLDDVASIERSPSAIYMVEVQRD